MANINIDNNYCHESVSVMQIFIIIFKSNSISLNFKRLISQTVFVEEEAKINLWTDEIEISKIKKKSFRRVFFSSLFWKIYLINEKKKDIIFCHLINHMIFASRVFACFISFISFCLK